MGNKVKSFGREMACSGWQLCWLFWNSPAKGLHHWWSRQRRGTKSEFLSNHLQIMRQASKLALRTQAGSTLLMRKLLQKAVNPVTKTTQVVQLVVEFEEVPSG